MVGSVNKVILLGRLGKDPDIRSMQNGKKVANFGIATSKRWTDRDTQEKKEKTSWHNIVVFNEGLVGIVEQYVKKGSKVYVEGSLRTRKWQGQDGQDRYTTEIVASEMQMLDSRSNSKELYAYSEVTVVHIAPVRLGAHASTQLQYKHLATVQAPNYYASTQLQYSLTV